MLDSSERSAIRVQDRIKDGLSRYWPVGIVAALFLTVQCSVLAGWWEIWSVNDSYFSHGPLIPFIVAYMIWVNRGLIARTAIRPSWIGLAALLPAAIIFVLGNWLESAFLHSVAFIAMLFGAMLLTFGRGITRLLTIPVLFILTMIPWSPTLLDNATNKLQMVSAAVASQFLRLSGYPNTLDGTSIYASGLPQPLIVGVPCSGLRTLISLLTFTCFFIYLLRSAWWKKTVLMALSLPLAVFINSLRITMIGYAGFWVGTAEAMQRFHDYSGYIGLAICFAMLFGIAKLIGAAEFGPPIPTKKYPDGPVERPSRVGAGVPGIAAILILSLAGLANVFSSPIYPSTKGKIVRSSIPMEFGDWTGTDLDIPKLEKDTLKMGDLLSRRYADTEEGRDIDVFVTAARNPDAFHDPHSCMPSGGSPITDDRIITLRFAKPRPMTVRATLLLSRTQAGAEYVTIYWYMMGRDSMPVTGDVWSRNRRNLVTDLRRLVFSPGSRDELRREIESRQFVWYRFSTGIWTDAETDTQALKRFISGFVAHTKDFGE